MLQATVETPGAVVQSPGLASAELGAAFELKFVLDLRDLPAILDWAATHLRPDPHGDGGSYRVTSVYCDTPELDVFHRSPHYRASKFRVRRYGASQSLFLERKTKRGDQVRKQRVSIGEGDLPLLDHPEPPADWVGQWFVSRVRNRRLRPTCAVTYKRTAFFGSADGMPIRMTVDHDLTGTTVNDWRVPDLTDGEPLLPGSAVMELKFHITMPETFRNLLTLLPSQSARASKYRRCITACGVPVEPPPALAFPGAASAVASEPLQVAAR